VRDSRNVGQRKVDANLREVGPLERRLERPHGAFVVAAIERRHPLGEFLSTFRRGFDEFEIVALLESGTQFQVVLDGIVSLLFRR
jgi:hypothetical protein